MTEVIVTEVPTKPVSKRVREYKPLSEDTKLLLAEVRKKIRDKQSPTLAGLKLREAALLQLDARPGLSWTDEQKAKALGVCRWTVWAIRGRVPNYGERRNKLALELLADYLPEANLSLTSDLRSADPKARALARSQLYELMQWVKRGSNVNVTQNTDNRRVECPPELAGIAAAELVRALAEGPESLPDPVVPGAQEGTKA